MNTKLYLYAYKKATCDTELLKRNKDFLDLIRLKKHEAEQGTQDGKVIKQAADPFAKAIGDTIGNAVAGGMLKKWNRKTADANVGRWPEKIYGKPKSPLSTFQRVRNFFSRTPAPGPVTEKIPVQTRTRDMNVNNSKDVFQDPSTFDEVSGRAGADRLQTQQEAINAINRHLKNGVSPYHAEADKAYVWYGGGALPDSYNHFNWSREALLRRNNMLHRQMIRDERLRNASGGSLPNTRPGRLLPR